MDDTSVIEIVDLRGAISDEMLLDRIADGRTDALEELYDRYAGFAFALARRMLSSREMAEEVTQDAFMSVWRQAATYNTTVGRVKPWLMSIVHHRAIDRMRRVRERLLTAQLDEAWMKAAENDVFKDVYRGVQREHILDALARLPEGQRQAVELAYFGGYGFREIAEATGTPEGTVKSRVRLALVKLRELISEEIAV